MKRSIKILLGLATLSPFVFIAGLVACFIYILQGAPEVGFEEYFQWYIPLFNLVSFLFTIYFILILVIFVVHAARNPNLEVRATRTSWLLALCILGPWVMPFYWFHHIWREGTR